MKNLFVYLVVAIIGAGVGAGGTWAVVKCDNVAQTEPKKEELAKTFNYYIEHLDIAEKVFYECKKKWRQ